MSGEPPNNIVPLTPKPGSTPTTQGGEQQLELHIDDHHKQFWNSYTENNTNDDNNSDNGVGRPMKRSNSAQNFLSKAMKTNSLATRRKNRRLSDLFRGDDGAPPSMPISPHFTKTFEFGKPTTLVYNPQKKPCDPKTNKDEQDCESKKAQQNETSSLPQSPHMHPLFLCFRDHKFENKFMKEFYFGESAYSWRITIVFFLASLWYSIFTYMSFRFGKDTKTTHIDFYIAIFYFIACIGSYLMCFVEELKRTIQRRRALRNMGSNTVKKKNNRVHLRSVQNIERLVLVILCLTFSFTMMKKGDCVLNSSSLDISTYLHIWTSLSLLRPRFIFQLVLTAYVIVSWITFATALFPFWNLCTLNMGRMCIHFISLVLLMGYFLMDSYGLERLTRRRFVSTRKEWLEHMLLEAEKKKSQTLLHNILPKALIPDLKKKKLHYLASPTHTLPDLNEIVPVVQLYDHVSVLLSDIENFTEFSSSHSAEDVLLILNIQFSYFDVVCKKLKIEKVKTIGDAFLAVGGLDAKSKQQCDERLSRLLTMGCGFLRIIDLLNRKYHWNFHVRIGVAYGEVIATVLGRELLTFDCFGKAIDEATYMERHAKRDSILTSRQVYDVAKDKFAFECIESGLDRDDPTEVYILQATNEDERITDVILDDTLHDMVETIIEQQCKSASDVITVRHARLDLHTPTSIIQPFSNILEMSSDVSDQSTIKTPTDRSKDGERQIPSIGHFSQSPLFHSGFIQYTLGAEESPSCPVSCTFPSTINLRKTPIPIPFFRSKSEDRKSLLANYKTLRTSTSTYLLSQLLLDLLFICVPLCLGNADILRTSSPMKVHILSTAIHLTCFILVRFTRCYDKSFICGVMMSLISLSSAIVSTFYFTADNYTRREIFPTAVATLMHILIAPPNLGFHFKVKLMIFMLGLCHLVVFYSSEPPDEVLTCVYASALCGLITNYIKKLSMRLMVILKSMTEKSKQSLRAEKQMNDNLILSVLLESTVERIRQGEINIFDNISDCSVCFIKIEGMKNLIETTANLDNHENLIELVAFLDLMVQTFDGRLSPYSCEKIKSANDVYMAVCGISYEVVKHTEQLLLFIFDVIEQFQHICDKNKRILRGCNLGLKIGLHSGPVSGGVLGYHRFLYDIFGDTVNCSARACSTSARLDQVQMAAEVFKRVKHSLSEYELTYDERGPVQVKGKGMLNMYYVRTALQTTSQA